MSGHASLKGMSALVTERVSPTATTPASSPRSARPSTASGETNASERRPARRPEPANIGRISTGCGVGIEAFASPIGA